MTAREAQPSSSLMTTPAASPFPTTNANAEGSAELPGVRWFVVRSLMWAAVLTVSVMGACALYAAASSAETSPRSINSVEYPAAHQAVR
jgi:hypothetical protein